MGEIVSGGDDENGRLRRRWVINVGNTLSGSAQYGAIDIGLP